MDNHDITGLVTPEFPGTSSSQTITLWSRQRRMQDFFNVPGQMYLALGKATPWTDSVNPAIDDTNPPVPNPNQTFINEIIGLQRVTWKMYCKPIINPSTDQKNQNVVPIHNAGGAVIGFTDGYVEYAGVYYWCTSDLQLALESGCTGVMVYVYVVNDDTFPYGITFRQTGLYIKSTQTALYLNSQQFNNLTEERRGYLELICNWPPHIRYQGANEEFYMLFSF